MGESVAAWSPEVQAKVASGSAVLCLGAGLTPVGPTRINVDLRPLATVEIVADAFDVLAALPAASVAGIESAHFLEHIDDLEGLLVQSHRVVRPGGSFVATVPHHANPLFYSDPTHRRFFGLYSMSYYAVDELHRRKVPHYRAPLWKLDSVTLGFKAPREFPVRNVLLRGMGVLFNSGRFGREAYEFGLSRLVPCYEVTYRLSRLG